MSAHAALTVPTSTVSTLTVPADDPMVTTPHRVVHTEVEAPDVVTVTLESLAEPLRRALPGQFVMAWVFGVGEIPISVSAVNHDTMTLALTVRTVGAVSAAIVALEAGDVIGVRGPYGTAWPIAEVAGRDVAVVAGGLGLAPLRTAIDALAAIGPSNLTVVVGARQPDQLLYPRDVSRWRATGVTVHTTVDTAVHAWGGAIGTATAQLERLGRRYDAAFICGPEPMMTSAARATLALGTQGDRVWLSLERNMHCGIAHCGRCQLGPLLLCRDGAIVRWDRVDELLSVQGR